MTITLRGAIIGVLAVALCVGLYLLWLWQPKHQVRLHTEHFFHAIDGRKWEAVADFIDEDYHDQWDSGFSSGCGKVFDGCASLGSSRP